MTTLQNKLSRTQMIYNSIHKQSELTPWSYSSMTHTEARQCSTGHKARRSLAGLHDPGMTYAHAQ